MILLIKLVVWVAIVAILTFTAVFTSKLADKAANKRIEKLNDKIAFLKDCRNSDAKDYRAMYQRSLILEMKVNELEKENAELKKALDKQENVTYNYYINK